MILDMLLLLAAICLSATISLRLLRTEQRRYHSWDEYGSCNYDESHE